MVTVALTSPTLDADKLRSRVLTSSKIINRGTKFNAHVSLQNIFDTPAIIRGWSWQLPPGLEIEAESPGNKLDLELQPGDSYSLVYTIRANGILDLLKKRTLARVGEHFVGINLKYTKDDVEHIQEIQSSLNIYASPIEIYFGAIIGAVFGSFARYVQSNTSLQLNDLFGFIVSAILGFFLVLIAKRRADVQLGVSIEDWVGGAVVGFTVGYLGTSYFSDIVGQSVSQTGGK